MRGFILRLSRIHGQIFRRLSIRKSGWSGKEGWMTGKRRCCTCQTTRAAYTWPGNGAQTSSGKRNQEAAWSCFHPCSMSLSFHRGNAFYWKNIIVADGYNLSCYPIRILKHASLLKKTLFDNTYIYTFTQFHSVHNFYILSSSPLSTLN